MKIAIVGAGIIGVTTAWELAVRRPRSHRCSSAGAPPPKNPASPTRAWSRPATSPPGPRPACAARSLRSLLSSHGAVKVRWPLSPRDLAGWRAGSAPASSKPTWPTARACSGWPSTAAPACTRSPKPANSTTSAATATWCCCGPSETASWCSPASRCCATRAAASSEIDADEARKIEPALNTDTALAGAIHLPDDEVGNCRQFAHVAQVRGRGAGRAVPLQLRPGAAAPGGAEPNSRSPSGSESHRFDAVVMCARGRVGRAAEAARPAHSAGAGLWPFDQRQHPRARSTRRAAR